MKIGFWELVVIVIVAFVFIGPDQLPVYAKKIGKMLRELKKYNRRCTPKRSRRTWWSR